MFAQLRRPRIPRTPMSNVYLHKRISLAWRTPSSFLFCYFLCWGVAETNALAWIAAGRCDSAELSGRFFLFVLYMCLISFFFIFSAFFLMLPDTFWSFSNDARAGVSLGLPARPAVSSFTISPWRTMDKKNVPLKGGADEAGVCSYVLFLTLKIPP